MHLLQIDFYNGDANFVLLSLTKAATIPADVFLLVRLLSNSVKLSEENSIKRQTCLRRHCRPFPSGILDGFSIKYELVE